MTKIRNLGSQESLGVELKDGICAELCLKLWFKDTVFNIFVILLCQDGFESDYPEKSQINNFLKSV